MEADTLGTGCSPSHISIPALGVLGVVSAAPQESRGTEKARGRTALVAEEEVGKGVSSQDHPYI